MTKYKMQDARSIVSTMLLGAQQQARSSKQVAGRPFVDLTAGDVHRVWIGGLKPNRMPMACNAMRQPCVPTT